MQNVFRWSWYVYHIVTLAPPFFTQAYTPATLSLALLFLLCWYTHLHMPYPSSLPLYHSSEAVLTCRAICLTLFESSNCERETMIMWVYLVIYVTWPSTDFNLLSNDGETFIILSHSKYHLQNLPSVYKTENNTGLWDSKSEKWH